MAQLVASFHHAMEEPEFQWSQEVMIAIYIDLRKLALKAEGQLQARGEGSKTRTENCVDKLRQGECTNPGGAACRSAILCHCAEPPGSRSQVSGRSATTSPRCRSRRSGVLSTSSIRYSSCSSASTSCLSGTRICSGGWSQSSAQITRRDSRIGASRPPKSSHISTTVGDWPSLRCDVHISNCISGLTRLLDPLA